MPTAKELMSAEYVIVDVASFHAVEDIHAPGERAFKDVLLQIVRSKRVGVMGRGDEHGP